MSGIRQSFIFALEDVDNYGLPPKKKGSDTEREYNWMVMPPGSFLSTDHNRAVDKIYSAGSKTFDKAAYGPMTGAWSWTFNMDYNYLEPFLLAFEEYSYENGVHIFKKSNTGRVRSFAVRRKLLNRMAGGPDGSDEMITMTGCVVRNIRLSRGVDRAQTSVTMTGFYSSEKMEKGTLDATDFTPTNGNLVEYACMFFGDVSDANYVHNIDSINLSIENSSDGIRSVCSPHVVGYYEGRTNYSFGVSGYSNDPSKFKQRLYSGGFDNTKTAPMSKGMAPLDKITFFSYSAEKEEGQDFSDLAISSPMYVKYELEDCIIKSMTWQKGDGAKLQDQISSSDFKNLKISIKSPVKHNLLEGPRDHPVTSAPPSQSETYHKGKMDLMYAGKSYAVSDIPLNVLPHMVEYIQIRKDDKLDMEICDGYQIVPKETEITYRFGSKMDKTVPLSEFVSNHIRNGLTNGPVYGITYKNVNEPSIPLGTKFCIDIEGTVTSISSAESMYILVMKMSRTSSDTFTASADGLGYIRVDCIPDQ